MLIIIIPFVEIVRIVEIPYLFFFNLHLEEKLVKILSSGLLLLKNLLWDFTVVFYTSILRCWNITAIYRAIQTRFLCINNRCPWRGSFRNFFISAWSLERVILGQEDLGCHGLRFLWTLWVGIRIRSSSWSSLVEVRDWRSSRLCLFSGVQLNLNSSVLWWGILVLNLRVLIFLRRLSKLWFLWLLKC